jgi:hypothetical protein
MIFQATLAHLSAHSYLFQLMFFLRFLHLMRPILNNLQICNDELANYMFDENHKPLQSRNHNSKNKISKKNELQPKVLIMPCDFYLDVLY